MRQSLHLFAPVQWDLLENRLTAAIAVGLRYSGPVRAAFLRLAGIIPPSDPEKLAFRLQPRGTRSVPDLVVEVDGRQGLRDFLVVEVKRGRDVEAEQLKNHQHWAERHASDDQRVHLVVVAKASRGRETPASPRGENHEPAGGLPAPWRLVTWEALYQAVAAEAKGGRGLPALDAAVAMSFTNLLEDQRMSSYLGPDLSVWSAYPPVYANHQGILDGIQREVADLDDAIEAELRQRVEGGRLPWSRLEPKGYYEDAEDAPVPHINRFRRIRGFKDVYAGVWARPHWGAIYAYVSWRIDEHDAWLQHFGEHQGLGGAGAWWLPWTVDCDEHAENRIPLSQWRRVRAVAHPWIDLGIRRTMSEWSRGEGWKAVVNDLELLLHALPPEDAAQAVAATARGNGRTREVAEDAA